MIVVFRQKLTQCRYSVSDVHIPKAGLVAKPSVCNALQSFGHVGVGSNEKIV